MLVVKSNILERTISGISPHHVLKVDQFEGVKNFKRIKIKRLLTHKCQEADGNFDFSAADDSVQPLVLEWRSAL